MTQVEPGAWLARVQRLSPAQKRALGRVVTAGQSSRRDLVAYLELHDDGLDVGEMREFLADRLPSYMVPSRYVVLDRLPRTSTGKLDRRGAGLVEGTELIVASGAMVVPRTDAEKTLAQIWRDVLGIDEVSVDDDFFEIGGDSLLSIRVISRAAREGLRITPESFFDGPTIARLASAGGDTGPPVEQGAVVGTAPLTPIQHWFFERITRARAHWNQAVLLRTTGVVDRDRIRAAIGALTAHHDALRVRFIRTNGRWSQGFQDVGSEVPLRIVDLAGENASEHAGTIEVEANQEHASLDLEKGWLFRAVLFDDGAGFGRLLLVAHHLVVDAMSWGILLEDLSTLVAESRSPSVEALPRKTGSALAWAGGLTETAGLLPAGDMLALWTGHPEEAGMDAFPIGSARRGGETSQTATHHRSLDEAATGDLLEQVAKSGAATLAEVILAGVVLGWAHWSGRSWLRLDAEGHGREALAPQLDVSRTVGWFTSVFPLVFRVAEPTAVGCLRDVREAFRRLPRHGATHGLLRYLHEDPEVRRQLAVLPRSEVLFNYLGSDSDTLPPDSPFEWAEESSGLARSPDAPAAYPIEVNARIAQGRLHLDIAYDPSVLGTPSIAAFGSAVEMAIPEIVGGISARGSYGLDEVALQQVSDLLAEIDGL